MDWKTYVTMRSNSKHVALRKHKVPMLPPKLTRYGPSSSAKNANTTFTEKDLTKMPELLPAPAPIFNPPTLPNSLSKKDPDPDFFNPLKGGSLMNILRVGASSGRTEIFQYSDKCKQSNPFNNPNKRASEVLQDLREDFKKQKRGEDATDWTWTLPEGSIADDDGRTEFYGTTLRSLALASDIPEDSLFIRKGRPRVAEDDLPTGLKLGLELTLHKVRNQLRHSKVGLKKRADIGVKHIHQTDNFELTSCLESSKTLEETTNQHDSEEIPKEHTSFIKENEDKQKENVKKRSKHKHCSCGRKENGHRKHQKYCERRAERKLRKLAKKCQKVESSASMSEGPTTTSSNLCPATNVKLYVDYNNNDNSSLQYDYNLTAPLHLYQFQLPENSQPMVHIKQEKMEASDLPELSPETDSSIWGHASIENISKMLRATCGIYDQP